MINFKSDVSLKDYCTISVGGNAKLLTEVYSLHELYEAYMYCITHNIKYKVIGLGANLVFDDNGFDGAIIVNRTCNLSKRYNSVFVSSGVTMAELINYCYNLGLTGLEVFAGIPSTIGGAIVNNLGVKENEIADFIDYIICKNKDNKTIILTKEECKFAYRNSMFKYKNLLILCAKINLKIGKKEEIKSTIINIINKKITAQPLNYPSAGSVFKRCEIIPAKVIDELGLKGTKIGGAEISKKHAGFIINTGNATSKDIIELVNLVKEKVKNAYNTNLETEIEFVN